MQAHNNKLTFIATNRVDNAKKEIISAAAKPLFLGQYSSIN